MCMCFLASFGESLSSQYFLLGAIVPLLRCTTEQQHAKTGLCNFLNNYFGKQFFFVTSFNTTSLHILHTDSKTQESSLSAIEWFAIYRSICPVTLRIRINISVLSATLTLTLITVTEYLCRLDPAKMYFHPECLPYCKLTLLSVCHAVSTGT